MIELCITMTGKGYSPRDKFSMIGTERKHFPDMTVAREFLTERYGKCKRVPMYQDNKDGQTIECGYVYGFRNGDWSHAPVQKWIQQDWVSFRECKTLSIA